MSLLLVPLLLLLLLEDIFTTKGIVLPILINKFTFLLESNFSPLLDFSRITDILYNPPSASILLLSVIGFFELTLDHFLINFFVLDLCL